MSLTGLGKSPDLKNLEALEIHQRKVMLWFLRSRVRALLRTRRNSCRLLTSKENRVLAAGGLIMSMQVVFMTYLCFCAQSKIMSASKIKQACLEMLCLKVLALFNGTYFIFIGGIIINSSVHLQLVNCELLQCHSMLSALTFNCVSLSPLGIKKP